MENTLLINTAVNCKYNMALWWFDIFMGWEVLYADLWGGDLMCGIMGWVFLSK